MKGFLPFVFLLGLSFVAVAAFASENEESTIDLSIDENEETREQLRVLLTDLDNCQKPSCLKTRRVCNAIVDQRKIIRSKITQASTSLRGCPNHLPKCVSLRTKILRLAKRYRRFGGKLRWYLTMARDVVYGPKHHTLKIPREYLAPAYKAAGVKLADSIAKTAKWTPAFVRRANKNRGRAARAFADAGSKKLARRARVRRSLKGRRAFKGRRNIRRNRRSVRRSVRRNRRGAKKPSWWRQFVIRATRPGRNERPPAVKKYTSPRRVVKRTKKVTRRAAKKALARKKAPRSIITGKRIKGAKKQRPSWYSESMVNKLFGPKYKIHKGRRVLDRGPERVRPKALKNLKKKVVRPSKPRWLRRLLAEKKRKFAARRRARRARRSRARKARHNSRWNRWGKRYGPFSA